MVAVEAAIARCMKARGFEYRFLDVATFTQGIRYRNVVIEGQAFPLGDVAETAVDTVDEPTVGDPNEAYLAGLDESARAAFDEALSGDAEVEVALPGMGFSVRTEGCRADAYEEVYGGNVVEVLTGSMIVGNLTTEVHARTQTDQRVLDAQSAWSACMTARGFSYSGFADAGAARAAAEPGDAVVIESADRACSLESGLTEVYRSVFNEQFDVAYEGHREELDRYVALRAAAIKSL